MQYLYSQNINNVSQPQSHLASKTEAYLNRCNKTLIFYRGADCGGDYASWKL